MIAGRPVLLGALQLTSRLVVLPEVADTDGAGGASGGSLMSVTLMVTGIVTVTVPSLAPTVTEYDPPASWL